LTDDSSKRLAKPVSPLTGSSDGISMRAADRFQIFESIALQRLQSGADAAKPAAFLPLPVRITAVVAAAIAALGVAWSFAARVPVQVKGTAVILPRAGMGSLVSATSGRLYYQVSGLASEAFSPRIQQQNKLLSRFWSAQAIVLTDEVNQVGPLKELVNTALLPAQGQKLFLPEDFATQKMFDQSSKRYLLTYPPGTMLAKIDDPLEHLQLNSILLTTLPSVDMYQKLRIERLKRSSQYNNLGKLQLKQRIVIIRELNNRRDLYKRLQQLWKQGFLPSTQLLDEQARINELQRQLLGSDSSELSTSISTQEQATQSKQSNIDDIQSRTKLEDQFIGYLNKTVIFVPEGGFYLLSRNFSNGSFVQKGDEIMTYSTSPPALPDEVPVFLDGPAAQQVNEGMMVLVTPKGVSRAEYGGIPGKVVRVSKLPLPIEGLVGVIGSRTLATSIQQLMPSPYFVIVKLQQAKNGYCNQALSRRCYSWSSRRLPPHPVRLASLADVQITTNFRRPVEFVMPVLRRALGLVVDSK